MATKDIYHEHVRAALEKDGWTVTDDPFRMEWRKSDIVLGFHPADVRPFTEYAAA